MRNLPGVVLLLALAAPAARAAEPVVLLPATGANVGEGELAAATDVLRADLEQTGRFTVQLAPRPGGNVPEPTADEAAEQAREAGAALAVTLRISRLGSATTARLTAVRPDGTVVHADQLGGAGADDLDPGLRRLAQGLAEARPAADLAQIDTVTEREAAPYRKRTATHVFGLRLEAGSFLDRPGDLASPRVTGGGMFWLYDARAFLAEATVDYLAGGDNHLLDTGLGVYLPLSKGNVSPYLGGGLAYAIVHTQDRVDAGIEVRAAGGVLVGRLSSVQLRIEAGYRYTTFEMRVHGDRRAVQCPTLSAGIGF